ncbi:MAG: hypothetical protein QGG40_20565, partial [Myxococcota bacterium]|nr:hypothetical protein [Myxococcota bacterium]
ATCMQYITPEETPLGPEDCLDVTVLPDSGDDIETDGQMYTAPWDTEGDKVTFRWEPGNISLDETVSITVRFLGAVDTANDSLVEGFVRVEPDAGAVDEWDYYTGQDLIDPDSRIPDGRRDLLACDDPDNIEWDIDDAHVQRSVQDGDAEFVPWLQGDPLHTVVEVTCTFDDQDGEFDLTSEILADALAYAQQYDAQGAIFYFTRSTSADIQTPPVRDRYGKRRDISSLKVVSRAVQMGRFQY